MSNSTTVALEGDVRLCACGECNLPVKPGRKFRQGHYSRTPAARAHAATLAASMGRSRATHGHTRGGKPSRTYQAWSGVKQRTTNPRHRYYRLYGRKGVKVDPSWLGPGGFSRFLSEMGEAPKGAWITRIDTAGDFAPGNCEWRPFDEAADMLSERAEREKMLMEGGRS